METAVAPSTAGAATPTPAPAQPAGEPARKIAPIPSSKAAPAAAAGPSAGGEGDGGGIDGKPQAAGAAGGSKREVLPGVSIGGDDIELPTRGPDGKFTSRAKAEAAFEKELAGLDGPEGDDEPGDPVEIDPSKRPPLPGQTGKVTFLGKEYASLAEVEHLHRTLQGMHGPIAQKLSKAEQDRDFGYNAANAWQQEAEKARAEAEQWRARAEGRAPAAGKPAAAGAVGATAAVGEDGGMDLDGLVNGIDYNAFEMIAHDPEGGTRVAGKFLASQILQAVVGQLLPSIKADIMKQVTPVLEPVQRDRASQETANAIGAIFDSVGSLRTQTGAQAFPELASAETMSEIGQVWRDSGQDPKYAMTPTGLISAIALWRLMKSLPDGVEIAPEAVAAAISPAAAALADGGGGADTGMGRASREFAHLSPDARKIAQSFDSKPLFDKTLGFARNRVARA